MRWILMLCLAVVSLDASAGWTLERERSSITYLSSKMVGETFATIVEPNRFGNFSGAVEDDGKARITIDLSSVDTGVAIRDERVRQHVFMVSRYPEAVVMLAVPEAARRGGVHDLRAMLTMRGQTHEVSVKISVSRTDDNMLLVQTVAPMLVNAQSYGMLDGFEKLRQLVNLFNIPTTIPVSFSLVFSP